MAVCVCVNHGYEWESYMTFKAGSAITFLHSVRPVVSSQQVVIAYPSYCEGYNNTQEHT